MTMVALCTDELPKGRRRRAGCAETVGGSDRDEARAQRDDRGGDEMGGREALQTDPDARRQGPGFGARLRQRKTIIVHKRKKYVARAKR